MTVDPTPEEFRGVTPHLVVADAEAAIGFYSRAFGADAFHKAYGPNGRIWHVGLSVEETRERGDAYIADHPDGPRPV